MLDKIDMRAAHLEKLEADVREWEKKGAKASEAQLKSRAAEIANELATTHAAKGNVVAEVKDADAKLLQAVGDALKSKIKGPIFLAGAANGRVALLAVVPKEFSVKIAGEQIDSGNCTDRWRQRRRATGECAGVRDRRWQNRQGACGGGAADYGNAIVMKNVVASATLRTIR